MIKDLFSDLFNVRAIEAIKNTVFERLWILALSMKEKQRIGDCGTVLNKSATGDEYKWGVRFYVLLLECFKQWTLYTEDADFAQKYERLKEAVPLVEDEFYYPQYIMDQVLDHTKADALAKGAAPRPVSAQPVASEIGQKSMRSGMQSDLSQSQAATQNMPQELKELDAQRKLYFGSLFTKTPNVGQIAENHMMLQSLYDGHRNKLASSSFPTAFKRDVEFYRKFSNLSLTESIDSPKGIAKLRGDVCQLLAESYGSYPAEYEQYLNPNSRSNSQQRVQQPASGNVFTAHLDAVEPPRQAPVRPGPSSPPRAQQQPQQSAPKLSFQNNEPRVRPARSASPNQNYDFDLNDDHSDVEDPEIERIRKENERLRTERASLRNVVTQLREKEKSLSQSMMMQSGLQETRRIDATPEILIDEINKKNSEYEALQAKYQTLMLQMDSRMKQDVDRSIHNVRRTSDLDNVFDDFGKRFDLGPANSRFIRNSRFVGNTNSSNLLRF